MDTFTLEDDAELTGRQIVKFTFRSSEQPVKSWAEMFQKVIRILYEEDKTVITRLAVSPDENLAAYFSMNPDQFRKSFEIGDGIYALTNTSTQAKLSVLNRLFQLYGEEPEDLVFYLRNDDSEEEPQN